MVACFWSSSWRVGAHATVRLMTEWNDVPPSLTVLIFRLRCSIAAEVELMSRRQ